MKVYPDRYLLAPNTIDIRINGVCNLACPWCWGPVHKVAIETVSNDQWKNLLSRLRDFGTRSVVFTGGEPLLRSGLEEIIEFAKSIGLRTTLSTNGSFLGILKTMLIFVDDIGLPLDGHTEKVNSTMRGGTVGSKRHFNQVIEAMRYVEAHAQKTTQLTIRTVLSSKNKESVPFIGGVLKKRGVNLEKWRWKIYQVTPEDSRALATINEGWLITEKEFEDVIDLSRRLNPGFTIKEFRISDEVRRYLFIDPGGEALVMGKDIATNLPRKELVGNLVNDFAGILKKVNEHEYSPVDKWHGI